MTLLARCVAVILLALLVTACTGPPGTSPPPPVIASVAPTAPLNAAATPSVPPLVSKACDDAFAAAAAVDDMHDTVTDLDPAVAACATLAEWTAASIAHPGAISEGVDPAVFLGNRCDETYLASTALCKSIAPSVAPGTAAIVAKLCAPPAYSRCASGAALFVEAMDPGTVLAVCAYGNGTGDVVVIDSGMEADAAAMCSGDGLISPSKVVRTVRLP
jgi:hypothetical protein